MILKFHLVWYKATSVQNPIKIKLDIEEMVCKNNFLNTALCWGNYEIFTKFSSVWYKATSVEHSMRIKLTIELIAHEINLIAVDLWWLCPKNLIILELACKRFILVRKLFIQGGLLYWASTTQHENLNLWFCESNSEPENNLDAFCIISTEVWTFGLM